ncbi:unnamed protein product [Danaus chrysippus]|uniref:(African queen) hypothetical protein n=1 Tax=Danaus chrysippus TaxID=151541 RepID=A0A8J2R1Q6_9NEOP|nr:unnamed protein product [Danaus chrysippus]
MNSLCIIIFFIIIPIIFGNIVLENKIDASPVVVSDGKADVKEEVPVNNNTRHAFFRFMDRGKSLKGTPARRVFGGSAAELKDFPAVCALLDRYFSVRCTATVISTHWVLTAAHCVTPRLAYVKYNTRRPASGEGNVTAIHYLYQHPKYKVLQKDEGRGIDVVGLHHDVGLVRTRDQIRLATPSSFRLSAIRKNNPLDLFSQDVKVFGFGRTERSVLGEELFSVQLRLNGCERSDWIYCVCGVASRSKPQGVCSGDSGGPVLYNGVPVGVTSMGPVECTQGGEGPPPGATSVFTSLHPYTDTINATIFDTEATLRMRIIGGASAPYSRFVALTFYLMIVR